MRGIPTGTIAGNILSMNDDRGVWRKWGYLDAGIHPAGFSGASYAFPTSITSYKGLGTSTTPPSGTSFAAGLTWDYNIAKPLTTVDVNSNTTSYSYLDPLERLTQITRPLGPPPRGQPRSSMSTPRAA